MKKIYLHTILFLIFPPFPTFALLISHSSLYPFILVALPTLFSLFLLFLPPFLVSISSFHTYLVFLLPYLFRPSLSTCPSPIYFNVTLSPLSLSISSSLFFVYTIDQYLYIQFVYAYIFYFFFMQNIMMNFSKTNYIFHMGIGPWPAYMLIYTNKSNLIKRKSHFMIYLKIAAN